MTAACLRTATTGAVLVLINRNARLSQRLDQFSLVHLDQVVAISPRDGGRSQTGSGGEMGARRSEKIVTPAREHASRTQSYDPLS